VVELKDPYLAVHQNRVKQLAVKIAKELKLPDYQIEAVKLAALVHDIGKISIPNEILYKPGKLNNSEFKVIKEHPKVGSELIKSSNKTIADIVSQHHERLDGSGYPEGLSKDEILIEARIIAAADVVEAMASHRPYRPALGIEKALMELEENRGKLYGKEITDICTDLFLRKKFKF